MQRSSGSALKSPVMNAGIGERSLNARDFADVVGVDVEDAEGRAVQRLEGDDGADARAWRLVAGVARAGLIGGRGEPEGLEVAEDEFRFSERDADGLVAAIGAATASDDVVVGEVFDEPGVHVGADFLEADDVGRVSGESFGDEGAAVHERVNAVGGAVGAQVAGHDFAGLHGVTPVYNNDGF